MPGLTINHKQSVPAIRVYSNNLKCTVWEKWRKAIPAAIHTRKAQEIYDKRLLGTFAPRPMRPNYIEIMFIAALTISKWKDTYKTKIALKAIAYVFFSAPTV